MRPLCGKPLIQWSIEAAFKSGCFDDVIVTSDSEEILSLARELNCYCIKRPPELATDTAPSFLAIIHALDTFEQEKNQKINHVMLLQPTSPLRSVADIKHAFALKKESGADSVISVCEMEHPPLWSNTLDAEGRMDDFLRAEIINKRSQDLPTYYRLNGAIYLAEADLVREHNGFFMPNSRALIMSGQNSVDIDTEIDFRFCEVMAGDVGLKR
jgi:CMP-N-acetylneuraminic acid synthetase